MNPLKHTRAYWVANNPILKLGQVGIETESGLVKTGDGLTAYNDLVGYDFLTQYSPAIGTDTYVADLTFPLMLGLFDGLLIRVKIENTNTGASTFNWNGTGAKAIKKNIVLDDLVEGDLSRFIFLCYDLTNDVWVLIGGATSAGEELIQSRVRSAATAMTTATPLNVTATPLTLTAGDWDVSAMVGYLAGAGTSITMFQFSISLTSATLSVLDTIAVPTLGEVRAISINRSIAVVVVGAETSMISGYRISIPATTTFYLVAQASFTISTLSAFGSIMARRVR